MAPADSRALSPFWTLQLIVWPAYGLISFVGALPYVGLAPHLGSVQSVIISKAVFAAAGFLCSSSMRILYRREKYASSWIRIAPVALLLSYSCGLLTTVCSNAARELATGKHLSEAWPGLFGGSLNASAVFLAWSACYFAVRNYHALEKEKRDVLRANALAQQAQLETLRSQVNPHFLFNALTSIHALIREDAQRAQTAVEELSELLRCSLTQSRPAKASLSEEIAVLERYLALERIRFEEKLSVSVEVQPTAGELRIPAFLLHPLLENAIKYGMQTSAMPLKIQLTAERTGNSLRVLVANTGRWVTPDETMSSVMRNGLGLRIVRQRLEQEYPGQHRFECRETEGWVESIISIQAANLESI
jgi:two-component sensor histidine kinase